MEGATRYRAVGRTSSVDESLFGNKGNSRGSSMSKSGGRRTVTGPLPPSAAVISMEELMRIKNNSIMKTDAEIEAEKERALLLKEEKELLSKQRKEKMRELERRSVQLAKKSDAEVREMAKKQKIRTAAEKQMDNDYDAVKLLNSMAQRAIAFTIRDQQLEEKKRLEQIEKEYDERLNMMIEIDRLKDIQKREDEEKYRKEKCFEDRKVINDQIAQRERQKMLAVEAREQENQAMRDLMERYKREDEIHASIKAKEIEASRKAVLRANEDAICRKQAAREAEKKEMEDILIYQAMKDAEMAKREEDEEAIARSKKDRQIKMLAQQEKAQNNAGKLDELRARRAAEDKERQERQKEKADAMKRKAEMKELLDSRAKQAADKRERQLLLKQQEEDIILMDLQYTKKMDEREEAERKMKIEKSNDHKVKLQSQIEERRAIKARTLGMVDETDNIRQSLIREEGKLSSIRDQMVQDLLNQGVNSKYLSEMRNVDIGKILKR